MEDGNPGVPDVLPVFPPRCMMEILGLEPMFIPSYTTIHHIIKNVLTDTTLHTGTQCANYPQSLMERVLLFFTHGNATYRAGCHHHNNNSSHHNDS